VIVLEALACLAALIGVAIALNGAFRGARKPELRLRQQLVDGEITEEEYFERESALRSTRERGLFRR
jgi:hypothetical protein